MTKNQTRFDITTLTSTNFPSEVNYRGRTYKVAGTIRAAFTNHLNLLLVSRFERTSTFEVLVSECR